MVTDEQLYELAELKELFYVPPYPENIDLTPKIEAIGIDITKMMEKIKEICAKGYNVGGHIECTIENVIPEYERSKRLVLDADHLEGLGKILLVARGRIEDY